MAKKPLSRPISPLYARYLSSHKKKFLRGVSADDPASEINLLRVLFAHFMEFQQSAPKDMDSRVQALRACLILSEQIAKLVRVHNKEQLKVLYNIFEPLSREWRGPYQALAKAIVEAHDALGKKIVAQRGGVYTKMFCSYNYKVTKEINYVWQIHPA